MDIPQEDIPPVPKPLIDRLQQLFPNRLPSVDHQVTWDEINMLRGRQDIIGLIAHWYEEQTQPQE